jgi:c-di-GMP-binding flagellar brake protein YcgR
MDDTTHELLDAAIARGMAAAVALPSAGMLRHHRTRFLAAGEGGFYIESVAGEARLIEELIVAHVPVGLAFKASPNKVVFAVPIWKRLPEFQVNREFTVEALLLPFPQVLKSVQRRASYRVGMPDSSQLSVRAWRIREHVILRDRPPALLELSMRVRDLSVGGMGVLCVEPDGKPASIVGDQRLRIVISYGEMEALVEGRVRHVRVNPDKSLRLGIQFKKLEEDLEGRQTLARLTAIVGQMHREEVRRIRIGMAG